MMQLELLLDVDGDGKLAVSPTKAKTFVYLTKCKLNPPRNPFVILPASGKLTPYPGDNFRVGYCVTGSFPCSRLVLWTIKGRCD